MTFMIFGYQLARSILNRLRAIHIQYSIEETSILDTSTTINGSVMEDSATELENSLTQKAEFKIELALALANDKKLDLFGSWFGNKTVVKFPMAMFPWFAGVLSGVSTLCIKCFVELVKTSNVDPNFQNGVIYVMFFAGIIGQIWLLLVLNQGLAHFDSLEVIPIYQSSVVLNNILFGGIVLLEFRSFEKINFVGFSIGSALVVLGILVTFFKKKTNTQTEPRFDSISTTATDSDKPSLVISEGKGAPTPFIKIPSDEYSIQF